MLHKDELIWTTVSFIVEEGAFNMSAMVRSLLWVRCHFLVTGSQGTISLKHSICRIAPVLVYLVLVKELMDFSETAPCPSIFLFINFIINYIYDSVSICIITVPRHCGYTECIMILARKYENIPTLVYCCVTLYPSTMYVIHWCLAASLVLSYALCTDKNRIRDTRTSLLKHSFFLLWTPTKYLQH